MGFYYTQVHQIILVNFYLMNFILGVCYFIGFGILSLDIMCSFEENRVSRMIGIWTYFLGKFCWLMH